MNTALVVLDTLRQDSFEKHFNWLPGRRFDHAWAPSHWTVPVHGSMFTGRYPSEAGVYSGRQVLDWDRPVLAEQLQNQGYRTRGLSCNINVSDIYSFDRGFDDLVRLGHQQNRMRHLAESDLYDWTAFIGERSTDGPLSYLSGVLDCIRSDCDTLRSLYYGLDMKFNLSGKIDRTGESSDMGARAVRNHIRKWEFDDNEFLYLNLMEAHTPYEIPASYKEVEDYEIPSNPAGAVEQNLDLEPLRTRYDNAARYLSDIYREIFAELEADFDYVITLSDHGELLGEHGFCNHSIGVYPELTHVPLVVSSGEEEIRRDDRLVSLVDVHETILQIAGFGESTGRGHPLHADPPNVRQALTEYHGISHPDRTLDSLREWLGSEKEVDRYQAKRRGIALDGGYYGYETIDGFQEEGTTPVDDPRETLAAVVNDLDIRNTADQLSPSVDESVREELEHLGYI